ncbi:competence pheromone ComX [Ammoniphilus sp. 3BR4]|uniref:competence pheromone ComX n=1 Tax=Ammoniphilus sp. 3BR4 TaxID=3158265 RepID=UPI00346685EE
MLNKVVEYLKSNNEIIEKLKDGTVNLVGLTEVEKQAVMDIFITSQDTAALSVKKYW